MTEGKKTVEKPPRVGLPTTIFQILLVILSLFAGLIVISVVLAIVGFTDRPLYKIGVWPSVILAAYFFRPRSLLSFFRETDSFPKHILIGLILGVAMAAIYCVLALFVERVGLGSPYQLQILEYVRRGPIQLVFYLFFANWVCAAIVEELIFRGFVLTRLSELTESTTYSVLGQALIFGAMHLPAGVSSALLASIFGLVLGIACISSNNKLIVPIVAHGVCNSILILGLLAFAE